MRGLLLPVWLDTWPQVWLPLSQREDAPEDLLPELYREFAVEPRPPIEPAAPDIDAYNEAGDLVRPEDIAARQAYEAERASYELRLASYQEAIAGRDVEAAFRSLLAETITTERASIELLERAYTVVDGFDVEAFRNSYFVLVEQFLEKFSLRYDLRRPFTLQPTITGIFAGLVRELRDVTRQDAHLNTLMIDFEDSIRDLRAGATQARIKTCIQKQINLLEAMGGMCPRVTENTLGKMCDQINTWPHFRVKESMKSLYKFASDYPGIRHGGNRRNAIRDIDMKDMVAITVLLAGFVPYLSHQLNSDFVYRGA
jgi:hypothetical protein